MGVLLFSIITHVFGTGISGNLQKVSNGYRLDFTTPALNVEQVDSMGFGRMAGYGGPVFSRIAVHDYDRLSDVGRPALPVCYFYLVITDLNQTPLFEVVDPAEEIITLPHAYFPAQIPWPKSRPISERPFSIDKSYYQSSGHTQTFAEVVETFTMRGVPCARVKICPFSYNPVEHTITRIKSCKLQIKTALEPKVPGLDSKDFESFLRYMTVNYDAVVEQVQNRPLKDNYLIISGNQWKDGLNDFVAFRNNRFNVSLVTTSQTGTSSSAIQSYIKGLNPVPGYILLVGDIADIPQSKGTGEGSTDLYYSTTSGDYKPEIFLGRFSVANSTDLSNIIKKTMFMETSLAGISKKAVLTGGEDAGSGDIAEKTHNDCISLYLTPKGYTSTKLYYNSNTGINKASLSGAINSGVIFNVYSGHGFETEWAVTDWQFGMTDIEQLTNTTSYPLTYGFACLTGAYYEAKCVTETYTRAKNGAVIAVGATISTMWDPDDQIERGMFKAIFDNANPQGGAAASLNAGKAAVTSDMQEYYEAYNLMGDPAISALPVNTGPYLAVSSPDGGESWEWNTTCSIFWGDNINGNVKIELLKGGSVKKLLAGSTESDGVFEWAVTPDAGTGADYKVRITSIDSAALFDVSSNNFSIMEEYYLNVPYVQTFDTLDTGKVTLPYKWEQLFTEDIDWIAWQGPTPSRGTTTPRTGAPGDHTTGNAKYIYVEATNNYPGKKASYITPKFRLSNVTNPVLSFWYHMFTYSTTSGAMGRLNLDICVDGVWKDSVTQIIGNKGDQWLKQTVDLNPYKGERVIFRFRAATGTSQYSDICLDDFRIDGVVGIETIAGLPPSNVDLKSAGGVMWFQIPGSKENRAMHVELKLYDVKGKLVKNLFNGSATPGTHAVTLNKTDGTKNPVAPGLYFCVLKTRGFNKVKSVMLTR